MRQRWHGLQIREIGAVRFAEVPLGRLIKNLEVTLAAYPNSLPAVLNLARTHAMAYSLKSDVATVLKGLPEAGWDVAKITFVAPVETTDPVKQRAAEQHLKAALALYERAAGMAPDDLIIALGHAWLIERSGNKARAIEMYRAIVARELPKIPAPRPLTPQPASQESKVVYVDSARQLFGNFTFWLFWANGYEALAVLDDDRDGTLKTGELIDLALWHDANGNGISEDGEVQTLAAHGIVALSYRYEYHLRHPDHIAFAPAGVTFVDGSSRPTYDLLLHPR